MPYAHYVCDPPNNTEYLENIIDTKDLVAFAVENMTDVNTLRKPFSSLKQNHFEVEAQHSLDVRCLYKRKR